MVFSSTIRVIPGNAAGPVEVCWGFRVLVGTSVIVAVVLFVTNVVQWKVQLVNCYYFLLAVVLFLLGIVAMLDELQTYYSQGTTPNPTSSTIHLQSEESFLVMFSSSSPPARGEDHSGRQALFSWDMMLIFIITTCGIGGLQTAMDNLGQSGESLLGYEDQGTISLLVSLANISSYAGRVLGGFGSEFVLNRYRIPRPLALAVTLVAACVGHLIIALGVRNGLYAASMLIGFCLGAHWSVLFAIISELFGLKRFSTIYKLIPVATIPGCYILNVQFTGRIYDQEAHRQGGQGQCIGVHCCFFFL